MNKKLNNLLAAYFGDENILPPGYEITNTDSLFRGCYNNAKLPNAWSFKYNAIRECWSNFWNDKQIFYKNPYIDGQNEIIIP